MSDVARHPSSSDGILTQEVARRRTFAIISHPDAGKTTLTERLLLYGGALNTAGAVAAKAGQAYAASEWMSLEQERGISISSSALQFEYKGCRFNLLDTPGHQDFSEDTYRTLIAADSAVMLLDAARGVQAQTERLFTVCRRREIPIFTLINKPDRPAQDPFALLEALLTAQIIDDLTDTSSSKNWESQGQGAANIVTGFFGGMAGCAMIGQSVINVTSGGRGRLSSMVAGVGLIFMILTLQPWVRQIPMGVLVAVMIMVSISTFDWSSLRSLVVMPKSDTIVMVATVATTVITHDLAQGVLVGVVLSALFFARKILQLSNVSSTLSEDGKTRTYRVHGQLFFVSTQEFISAFDVQEDLERVVIDLTQAHLWDGSAVAALDKVAIKFMRRGTKVELIGQNEASDALITRLAVHDKPGALERSASH